MAPRGTSSTVRRAGALLAVALGLGLSLAAPIVHDVEAATGTLETSGSVTYTANVAKHLVHVTADETALNFTDDALDDRYFYTAARFAIQPEATNIRAHSGSKSLDVGIRRKQGYSVIDVGFGRRLYHNQRTSLTVDYDLPGGAPRSASTVRVESAVISFTAWSLGTNGSVHVQLPKGFDATVEGGPMSTTGTPAAGETLTATGIADATDWYAFIDAEAPAAFVTRAVSLSDGKSLTVSGWPDDAAWSTRVADRLDRGIPILESLIGSQWPVKGQLSVTEKTAVGLEGYAGFYLTDADEIQISEDLDDLTIVHESSHAWFNQQLFRERWINEGLADTYATLVLDQLKLRWDPIARPNRTSTASFALAEWPTPDRIVDEETDARERYGYAASYFVIDSLVREVGPAKMRAVFAAAAKHEIAYVGAPAPEATGIVDSRRFLDLLTERAGSKQAAGLFETWILGSGGDREIRNRASARAAYALLVEHGHGWLAPFYVRRQMAAWNFGDAKAAIVAADQVLSDRDAAAERAQALGLTLSDEAKAAYESATDGLSDARAAIDTQLDALNAIGGALTALGRPRDGLAQFGLWNGTDPAQTIDRAKAAFSAGQPDEALRLASEAEKALDGAAGTGRERVLLAFEGLILVLVVVAAGTWLGVRRRRQGRVAALAFARVRMMGEAAMAAGAPPPAPWSSVWVPGAVPTTGSAAPRPAIHASSQIEVAGPALVPPVPWPDPFLAQQQVAQQQLARQQLARQQPARPPSVAGWSPYATLPGNLQAGPPPPALPSPALPPPPPPAQER